MHPSYRGLAAKHAIASLKFIRNRCEKQNGETLHMQTPLDCSQVFWRDDLRVVRCEIQIEQSAVPKPPKAKSVFIRVHLWFFPMSHVSCLSWLNPGASVPHSPHRRLSGFPLIPKILLSCQKFQTQWQPSSAPPREIIHPSQQHSSMSFVVKTHPISWENSSFYASLLHVLLTARE